MTKILCIGGSPSSGTTLFADLIDSVPGIICGPELNIFCIREAYHFDADFKKAACDRKFFRVNAGYSPRSRFFNSRYFEQTGMSEETLHSMIAQSVTFGEFIDSYSRHFAAFRKRKCDVFAEKTPINISCAAEFCTHFPEGLFVHIVRDRSGVVNSLMRRGFSLYEAGKTWLEQTERGKKAALIYPNVMEIYYEDLISRPFQIAAEIASRLKIQTDAEEIKKEFERNEYRRALPRPQSWRFNQFLKKDPNNLESSLAVSDAQFLSTLVRVDFSSGKPIPDGSMAELSLSCGFATEKGRKIDIETFKGYLRSKAAVLKNRNIYEKHFFTLVSARFFKLPLFVLLASRMFWWQWFKEKKGYFFLEFLFPRIISYRFQKALIESIAQENKGVGREKVAANSVVVAIVVDENQTNSKKIKSFFDSLGMPQVVFYTSQEALPPSVKVVIAWSAPEKAATLKKRYAENGQGKKVFLASQFEHDCKNSKISAVSLGVRDGGASFSLSTRIEHRVVPSLQQAGDKATQVFRLSAKYAVRFLRKSSLVNAYDRVMGLALSVLFFDRDSVLSAELLQACGVSVVFRKQEMQDAFVALIEQQKLSFSDHENTVLWAVKSIFDSQKYSSKIDCSRSDNATASELCRRGIIAFSQNDQACMRNVWQELLAGCYDPAASYILTAPAARAFYYRPDLCFFADLATQTELHTGKFPVFELQQKALQWLVREASGDTGEIQAAHFWDEEKHLYSTSLVENLIALLTPPEVRDGCQYDLSARNFAADFLILRKIWGQFLTHCLHTQGLPAIQLFMWPGDKQFALSLRYDADRPLSDKHIHTVEKLEKNSALAPCSSGYFFIDDKDFVMRSEWKKRGWEEGVHSRGGEASTQINGRGITHHNAPNSVYWRGPKKDIPLNPFYSEFLSAQLGTPFLWGNATEDLWVVPLHFPMEAGTQLKNEYSDFFQKEYRPSLNDLVRLGGHLILSSHPDLSQTHTEKILRELPLKKGWAVPVFDVVSRCRLLFGFGKIQCSETEGRPGLFSRFPIPDLQATITYPRQAPEIVILQLKPEQVCAIQ